MEAETSIWHLPPFKCWQHQIIPFASSMGMKKSNPETPISGKDTCSRGDIEPFAIIEAPEFPLHLNKPQDPSRWKPLIEGAGLNITPEPAILVPDPSPTKTLHDSDGDTPTSETLGGSLSRRRRHGEYHHRPPVWNIRPLDEDISVSSSIKVELDSDILDSLNGLKMDSTSFHSQTSSSNTSYNLIPQPNISPNAIISDSLLEEQLNTTASTWSREPFIIAMAGTDVEDSNGSDGDQRNPAIGFADSRPDEPPPDYSRLSPRSRITPWPASYSTQSTDEEPPHMDTFASSEPGSGILHVSDSVGPSSTSGGIHARSHEKESNDRGGEKESGHFHLSKCPSLSPVIEQPQDENSPPRELEGGLGPYERETVCSVTPTTVEQPRDVPAPLYQPYRKHGHSEQNESAPPVWEAQPNETGNQQLGQPEEENESSENIETSSTPARIQPSQGANSPAGTPETGVAGPSQLLPPYQQQRIEYKHLSTFRDIRCLQPNRFIGYPLLPKRKFGWAIEAGSRVICVCDTVADWEYNDVFPMRLGDAYIVLKMYGDFWASCLKLTLDDQTWSAYPIYERHRDRTKSTYICPDKNVQFLPLCALTLDANFGDYLARHPRNGGPCYSPATGQEVVPPERTFSHPRSLRYQSVVVPKKILRQAKYPNMPRDTAAIHAHDFVAMDIGHVCESKPSDLLNVDPDYTHITPVDNILRFKTRIEKKISRLSLREASAKVQESSAAIGGHLRRKFHSDPGSSGIRRFFTNRGASSTDTPTGPSESDSHQTTEGVGDTADQTEAVGGNPDQATEETADSLRATAEGNPNDGTERTPQPTTTNPQQRDQITTTVNEVKR
ncbi:uncharacterized protein BDCG_03163 [Blastomyces dermatitidis ER-3]|uniref:Uncharacterized protein n=1 Tax=Ajellomyces dermatitidis (strain ER-3 / ATCC MYA-2586) TaxID=559297 RepID=A0ABP2EVQ3_AJEDR|nr:uncharacterized protein BDCG_03163 [Blastomyces dermatitidis ER-3]EEQ88043.2 hypothetical protein BDCG_03163 [Blastomyces dermatitidis ER-3]